MLNGRTAKASAEVKEGDILEISFGNNHLKVKVLSTSEHVRKEDAAAMYEPAP